MGKLFFREKAAYRFNSVSEGIMENRKKCVIGVIGIGQGAGATFVSMSLAFCLGKKEGGVVFVEGKSPDYDESGAYRILSVDKNFREMKFIDYFLNSESSHEKLMCYQKNSGEAQEKLMLGRTIPRNIYKNVSWILHSPENCYEGRHCTRYDFDGIYGRYIIVDNPEEFENPEDYDILIVVVDPLPSRISSGQDIYRKIKKVESRNMKSDIIYVLNKCSSKAVKRYAENFLKIKFDFDMDNLSLTEIYRSQYSCSQPYFNVEMPELEKIATSISNRFSSYFTI